MSEPLSIKIVLSEIARRDALERVTTYSDLCEELGCTRMDAETAVRFLKREGLAWRATAFDDEGKLCGSGVMLTTAGRIMHDEMRKEPQL